MENLITGSTYICSKVNTNESKSKQLAQVTIDDSTMLCFKLTIDNGTQGSGLFSSTSRVEEFWISKIDFFKTYTVIDEISSNK